MVNSFKYHEFIVSNLNIAIMRRQYCHNFLGMRRLLLVFQSYAHFFQLSNFLRIILIKIRHTLFQVSQLQVGHKVRTLVVWDAVGLGGAYGADSGGVGVHALDMIDQLLLIELLWTVVALVLGLRCQLDSL